LGFELLGKGGSHGFFFKRASNGIGSLARGGGRNRGRVVKREKVTQRRKKNRVGTKWGLKGRCALFPSTGGGEYTPPQKLVPRWEGGEGQVMESA